MLDFSIIILLNRARNEFLRLTLSSILKQDYRSFEIIILDKSGFLASDKKLKKYLEKLNIKFRMIDCNEMDLSQAMNTGVRVANGKYVTFLESGNELEENSLSQAIKSAQKYPQADATYGVYGPWERPIKKEMVNSKGNVLPIKNTQFVNLYYRKDLHQRFGFYNTKEKVVANYAFCLKAFYLGGAIVRPFDIKINKEKELSI